MKTKRLVTLLLVLATAFCAAFAVGCKKKPANATVESVMLSATQIELNTGDAINYADYTVTAKYSDGKQQTLPLTEKMFGAEDLAKLNAAGTYTLTVTAFGKQASLSVTVKNRTFADVSADDVTKIYDGEAIVPEIKNAPQGATVVWTFRKDTADGEIVSEPVNAGVYYAQGVVSLKNYDDKTVTAKITVNKKLLDPAALEWLNVKRVYTGKEITVNAVPDNLPDGITVVGYEGDVKGTDKKEYTVTVKFANENPNYDIAETYSLKWSIVAPLEAKWLGAKDGNLFVASFENLTDATGRLTFNGKTTDYKVKFDEKLVATFSELNGNVTAITLNGQILTLGVGSETYTLISEDDLNTYFAGNEYDLLLAQIKVNVDEAAAKLTLEIATADGETSYPLTLKADATASAASAVKLYATEDLYLEYYNEYGVGYPKLCGFDLTGYKADDYELATKAEVAAVVKNLIVGTFKDEHGNVLVVNGYNDVKLNGKASKLFAVVNSQGKVALKIALNSDKNNQDLTIKDGWYTVTGLNYSNSPLINEKAAKYLGTYYISADGAITDGQTVAFTASYGSVSFSTKLVTTADTAESNTFNVVDNKTENRAVLTLGEDGKLTATLYLKDSDAVYATLVFSDGGASVSAGDKNFVKVDKLIEKSSGFDGEYYSADGASLKYDGKGKFTLNGVDYTKYTLQYADDTLTVTIGENEDTHVIVYTEKRFVTVDGEIFLNDLSGSLSDGYKSSAEYKGSEGTLSVNKNVIKVNDVQLTDLAYSFADDGNGNGRTVLKVTAKLGENAYELLFYSLATVKAGDKAFVSKLFVPYYGETYKPVGDENKSFTVTLDGKVELNGKEIIVDSLTNSSFVYYLEKDGKLFKVQMYDNSSYGYLMIDEGGVQLNYTSEFFRTYRGYYLSEDKASVFAFADTKLIFASGSEYTEYSVKSKTADAVTLNVGGEDAVFSTADGVNTVVYKGKTYKKDKTFAMENYFGKYSAFGGSAYDDFTFVKLNDTNKNPVVLSNVIVFNGNITPIVKYSDQKKAYLIKNTDADTASQLPYYAIVEDYIKYVGSGKLNGKVFAIDFSISTKNNKTVPVINASYDGKAVTLTDLSSKNRIAAEIDGKAYTIEPATDDEKALADLKIYESAYSDFTGNKYTFNGSTSELVAKINADGESVIAFTFNGQEVSAQYADATFGKTVTFACNGVNYKGNLAKNGTPKVRVVTVAEYEFFFDSEYNEATYNYSLTIGGKTFTFKYDVKALNRNNDMYEFVFDLSKTSYDGKPVTEAYYSYGAQAVVFATADGTFAYKLADKSLVSGVTYEGVLSLVNNKYVSNADGVYVTARVVSLTGNKAVIGYFYDLNSEGLKAATTEKIEGGYKLSVAEMPDSYLLEESGDYKLYTANQHLFAGSYKVGEKDLVITGKHANGKYTYTASYGGGAAVSVTPDFAGKSLTIKETGKTTLLIWSEKDGVRTFRELPEKTLKFCKSYVYMANLENTRNEYELAVTFKGVVDGKIKYNVKDAYGKNAEGTLSDDGNYISVYMGGYDLCVFLNAQSDEYYEYVAVKKTSSILPYLGKHTVGGETIEFALGATSDVGEDEDGEDCFGGFASSCIKVTYKGKTVNASTKYSSSVSSIEFTIDNVKYVAKITDGVMTVEVKK